MSCNLKFVLQFRVQNVHVTVGNLTRWVGCGSMHKIQWPRVCISRFPTPAFSEHGMCFWTNRIHHIQIILQTNSRTAACRSFIPIWWLMRNMLPSDGKHFELRWASQQEIGGQLGRIEGLQACRITVRIMEYTHFIVPSFF